VLEERLPKLMDVAVEDGPESVAELRRRYVRALEIVERTT
jgi:hypothetical protein